MKDEITDSEKFEIIWQKLKETNKTLSSQEFEKLCSKIMNLSTEKLAIMGASYIERLKHE